MNKYFFLFLCKLSVFCIHSNSNPVFSWNLTLAHSKTQNIPPFSSKAWPIDFSDTLHLFWLISCFCFLAYHLITAVSLSESPRPGSASGVFYLPAKVMKKTHILSCQASTLGWRSPFCSQPTPKRPGTSVFRAGIRTPLTGGDSYVF